ncbi:hypothetical protein HBH70_025520 [Parastagonospora nodorum]|nr:hypothetical protein HBH70_025520 [Parastagonospora nodorum]KAH5491395.1 hypothetical protein HBI52_219570 [Parastagonospora nodorum]KAH5558930.1 hypothetical protein HBI26_206490 [Parastagonospora nodorum]KAH5568905.1 hypothetical protein HBI24_223430 [Parastagonospora nodorum]
MLGPERRYRHCDCVDFGGWMLWDVGLKGWVGNGLQDVAGHRRFCGRKRMAANKNDKEQQSPRHASEIIKGKRRTHFALTSLSPSPQSSSTEPSNAIF